MKTKAEIVFKKEMSYIEDAEILRFIIDVFSRFTPDYFWTVPCSTSGKYHPRVSLGSGGLIRHVKLAVWWGLEIMQCWPNLSLTAIDEVTAALILHDLNKNGEKLDPNGFPTLKDSVSVHGPYLGNRIRGWMGGLVNQPETKVEYNCPDRINRILAAIDGHMGIWTNPSYEMSKPQYTWSDHDTYNVCTIVHLSDYCSSRKVDDEMMAIEADPVCFEVMYGIGQEDDDLGVSMWAGPVPDKSVLMRTDGRDGKSILMKIDPIYGDTPIYRWAPSIKQWVNFQ